MPRLINVKTVSGSADLVFNNYAEYASYTAAQIRSVIARGLEAAKVHTYRDLTWEVEAAQAASGRVFGAVRFATPQFAVRYGKAGEPDCTETRHWTREAANKRALQYNNALARANPGGNLLCGYFAAEWIDGDWIRIDE